mgnify:CR=1 FL=1
MEENEEIKNEDVIRQFEAPARIMAKYRVEVLARISGYLTKSYFKEGDFVKAGQVLFEIEPQEYQYFLWSIFRVYIHNRMCA